MSAIKSLISTWKTLSNPSGCDESLRVLLSHLKVNLIQNNIYAWLICLRGFPNTVYEKGHFLVSVQFPPDFPHNVPTVRFLTPIFHPNVGSDGSVSLEFTDSQPLWHYFLNLLFFLNTPNPALAINPEAASLYVNDLRAFEQAARTHTERDASDFHRFTLQNRILNPHLQSSCKENKRQHQHNNTSTNSSSSSALLFSPSQSQSQSQNQSSSSTSSHASSTSSSSFSSGRKKRSSANISPCKDRSHAQPLVQKRLCTSSNSSLSSHHNSDTSTSGITSNKYNRKTSLSSASHFSNPLHGHERHVHSHHEHLPSSNISSSSSSTTEVGWNFPLSQSSHTRGDGHGHTSIALTGTLSQEFSHLTCPSLPTALSPSGQLDRVRSQTREGLREREKAGDQEHFSANTRDVLLSNTYTHYQDMQEGP